MNRISKSIAAIVVLTLTGLVGCGKSEPKPPPKVEDTVFGDMVAAKERARKETEKAMAENQKKLEEAMKKTDESSEK